MGLTHFKRQFLEYLEIERGRSIKTIENYDRYLTVLIEFLKSDAVGAITEDAIREYRLWLNRRPDGKGGTLKRRTQNYYLIALRAFLKYLRRRGIDSLAPERIELAKVPERSLDLITAEELERLFTAASGDDEKSLRNKAMLELFFSTGLRVSELVALNRDMDLARDELSVRGKGDKVRVVFLSPSSKDAVRTYLGKRGDIEDALFVHCGRGKQPKARLTARSIERIVKQLAIRAGIQKKVTPHVIRHSFATDLLQNGADLRSVQALLGHANIATTQVYTHVTDRHLHDIHQKFHGKQRKG